MVVANVQWGVRNKADKLLEIAIAIGHIEVITYQSYRLASSIVKVAPSSPDSPPVVESAFAWQAAEVRGRLILIVAAGLVALCVQWTWQEVTDQALVEIDQATPVEYQFSLDINSAGVTELCLLPEVGPVMAERIVEYREQNGQLKSHEALLDVYGIGPKTLAKLIPYLQPIKADAPPAVPSSAIPPTARR